MRWRAVEGQVEGHVVHKCARQCEELEDVPRARVSVGAFLSAPIFAALQANAEYTHCSKKQCTFHDFIKGLPKS